MHTMGSSKCRREREKGGGGVNLISHKLVLTNLRSKLQNKFHLRTRSNTLPKIMKKNWL